jgi:hypothetical protein
VAKIAKNERPNSQGKVNGKDGMNYPARGKRNDIVEDVQETVLHKTLPTQYDHILTTLKAALDLTVDTQERSDALLHVIATIFSGCFDDRLVRRDFLQSVVNECAVYAVHPIEPNSSHKDAA